VRDRRPAFLVWVCLLAGLSACGAPEAVEPGAAPKAAVADDPPAPPPPLAAPLSRDRLAGLDLPRTGTFGALPAAYVLVTIPADGRMKVDGTPCDYEGLTTYLARRLEAPGARELDGSSRVDLVLAVDPATPWGLVQWAMQSAAHPRAKMYRIHFAVRPEVGDEPGALATFLPRDNEWRHLPPTFERHLPPAIALHLREGGRLDEEAVFAVLRAEPDETRSGRPALSADETVPCGVVLRIVDVVFRAGFKGVVFVGKSAPKSAEDVAAVVARARAETRTSYAVVGGVEIAPTAPRGPLPPGTVVAGHPAGDWRAPAAPAPDGTEGFEIVEEVVEETEPAPSVAIEPASGAFRGSREAPRKATDGVEEALRWLRAHQMPEGEWSAVGFASWCDGKPYEGEQADGAGDADRDVAVTALALHAFLAAGYTVRSEGPFGDSTRAALRRLRDRQEADGGIGARTHPRWLSDHAVATLAFLRHYGHTGSVIWRTPAVAGVRFLLSMRGGDGAWSANGPTGESDVVTSAWAALVVRGALDIAAVDVASGRDPFLEIDARVLSDLLLWVNAHTEVATGRFLDDDRRSTLSVSTATAAALAIRAAARDPADTPAYRHGIEFLLATPPDTGAALDAVGWYWASVACWNAKTPTWKSWGPLVKVAWIDRQRNDATETRCVAQGSWDPGLAHDGLGRVGTTALGVMCISFWYRYDKAPGMSLRDR
jgi:biopolymer transport protein ExbD